MEDELEDAGVPVELHRYSYESWRFFDERNRIDYHRKREAFLERHLKAPRSGEAAEPG